MSPPLLQRDFLRPPYWAFDLERMDDLPSRDFNREIIHPGTNETFPEGAVGVRIDDDFWAVAALPYDEFRKVPIEQLVAAIWPRLEGASFHDDTPSREESLSKEVDRLCGQVNYIDRKFMNGHQTLNTEWLKEITLTREEWYAVRFPRESLPEEGNK